MSASSSGNTRPRPPPGFLSRIPASELKLIRVAVRRSNITTSGSPGPIERTIDDPKAVIPLVHLRKDDARRPKNIFDHEGVVVNQEERLVLADANQFERQRHRSKTHSRSRSRSPRRDRSRSSNYRRSRSSSLSKKSVEKDRRRVVNRDSDRRKSLGDRRSTEREKRSYNNREYSRERENDRGRRRSITPLRPGEYRPSHPDLKRRSRSRGREYLHDKNRMHSRRSRSSSRGRSRTSRKSPSPGYDKPSTSRKFSRSPDRRPRYGKGGRDPGSASPAKLDKSYYSERRRERSPAYKSPDKRRSRSPPRYDRDRRRSRSPVKRVEGNKRTSPARSSRRYSRSPGRYDTHKSPPDRRRSSRSPHPPVVSFSKNRPDYRRSSRSPGHERDRGYRRRRSRSRSPKKHGSRSPRATGVPDYPFYEGIPGAEYWIPGPIRPGFPGIPRYYQPGFFPRPIILPPRFPVMAPYQYPRQRLPVYNSKQKPKVTDRPGNDGAGSGTVTEPSAIAGTSSSSQENVVIQEVVNIEARKNDGSDRRNVDEESRDSLHERD